MRKIYFIRHGETNANVMKRYCGHTDIPINENGIVQAKTVANIIKNYGIELMYCSDLKRAKMTMKEINKFYNLDITYLTELREMNFGILEDLTFKEIGDIYPKEKEKIIKFSKNYQFPEGESLEMLYLRANSIFKEIINKNKNGNILIVSHGGVIESILTEILSNNIEKYWNIEIDNCKIATVVDNEGFLYLSGLNSL
ncbi:MAG: histidine phosphatase family protein [Bacillota bacterium]|nr:histidine phosphatase family protein [Bacillota bacterium]